MSTHKAQMRIGVGVAGIAAAAVMGIVAMGTSVEVRAQQKLTVWDGVYAEEQATRGKDEYEYSCGSCHIHDLSGDSIKDIPPLAGPDFLMTWQGKTVKELMEYISTNMPQDSRGSLPAKTISDIAAYVLKVNTFPAGSEDLSADSPKVAATIRATK